MLFLIALLLWSVNQHAKIYQGSGKHLARYEKWSEAISASIISPYGKLNGKFKEILFMDRF